MRSAWAIRWRAAFTFNPETKPSAFLDRSADNDV